MSCNKNTPRCNIDFKHEKLPDCCKNNLKEMLTDIDEILNEENIPYWIDYGTLLGAVREGDILDYDEDADIGILKQDSDKLLNISWKFLEKKDLYFYIYGYPYEVSINYGRYNNLHVDIFFWEFERMPFKYMWEDDIKITNRICLNRKNYQLCDEQKGKHFPAANLFPLEKIKLGDHEYYCPKEPEKFVEFRYGLDWRIPKIL